MTSTPTTGTAEASSQIENGIDNALALLDTTFGIAHGARHRVDHLNQSLYGADTRFGVGEPKPEPTTPKNPAKITMLITLCDELHQEVCKLRDEITEL